MKIHKMTFLFLSILFCSVNIINGQQENPQAEEMKAWTEYMTPGPMHEMLATSVGDWKTISRFWMDASGEPMETEGTRKTEMILGGRYQKSTHNSTMMGMLTEGLFLIGFDNATQEFTAVWIDNIGTGTAIANGSYDENTKSINLKGTMVDPMNKSNVNFREVYKYLDNDHHLLEMYIVVDGEESKLMEIEFFRQ